MKKILFFMLMILFSQSAFGAKYIALTFDDGPNPTYTPQVLEILKKNNINATFFLIGKNAQSYPQLVKQELQNGNDIGNHSYSHPYFTKIGDKNALDEMTKTNQIIEKITGEKPKFWRPPYGLWDKFLVKNLSGQTLTMRNIEGMDRSYKTKDGVKNQILKNAKSGGIILIHDIHPWSVEALDETIKTLKSQGYEFVTISQLQKLSPSSLDPMKAKYIPDSEKKLSLLPDWLRTLELYI